MKERGFNSRYVQQYEKDTIFTCGPSSNGKVDPIELIDVLTAFLVVCVGFIFSGVLLVLEKVHKSLKGYKLI